MTRVRFAPSPTGTLHVGNALSAVANRRLGDYLLLRIDDTDPARNVAGGEEAIEADLGWPVTLRRDVSGQQDLDETLLVTVRSSLEAVGADVLLTLTHRQLVGERLILNVSAGWHAHLALLVARLENTPAPSLWATWKKVRTEYEELSCAS